MKTLQKLFVIGNLFLTFFMTSCMGDDTNEKYKDWRNQNIKYVSEMQALTADGKKVYTTVVPDWSPGSFVLMKWHNDRSLTQKNLSPLFNSTCRVKYRMSTIEGVVDSSFNMTTYGDSLYQCRPSTVITGFAIALTNMHIGDSCQVIVPYYIAYDQKTTSTIKKPFTTLIYDIKLESIPAYEIPM